MIRTLVIPPPLAFREISSYKDLKRYSRENKSTIFSASLGLLVGFASTFLIVDQTHQPAIIDKKAQKIAEENLWKMHFPEPDFVHPMDGQSSENEPDRLNLNLSFFKRCFSALQFVTDFDRLTGGRAEQILRADLNSYPEVHVDDFETLKRALFHTSRHFLTSSIGEYKLDKKFSRKSHRQNVQLQFSNKFIRQEEITKIYEALENPKITNFSTQKLHTDLIFPQEKVLTKSFFRNWITLNELDLPSCNFDPQQPIHRERYVVCQQMIDFFAQQISYAFLNKCQSTTHLWAILEGSVSDLGSYLLHAEDHTKMHFPLRSSWSIRAEWDERYKETYCQQSSNIFWKAMTCFNPDLDEETLSTKTLKDWNTQIWPTTKTTFDTYSSLVFKQIKKSLKQQVVTDKNTLYKSNRLFEALKKEVES